MVQPRGRVIITLGNKIRVTVQTTREKITYVTVRFVFFLLILAPSPKKNGDFGAKSEKKNGAQFFKKFARNPGSGISGKRSSRFWLWMSSRSDSRSVFSRTGGYINLSSFSSMTCIVSSGRASSCLLSNLSPVGSWTTCSQGPW